MEQNKQNKRKYIVPRRDKDISFIAIFLIFLLTVSFILIALEQRTYINQFSDLRQEIKSMEYIILQEKGVNLTKNDGYYNGFYFVVETKDKSMEEIFKISTHEIGHHFMNTNIDVKQLEEWNLIYNESDQFISIYANKSENEDFAESFTYVIRPCYFIDNVKDLSPERQEYFNKNVKPYFEVCRR
jgi:hypothetical protein